MGDVGPRAMGPRRGKQHVARSDMEIVNHSSILTDQHEVACLPPRLASPDATPFPGLGTIILFLLLAGLICGGLPAAASVPVVEGSLAGRLVLSVETADAGAFGLQAGEAVLFVAEFEIELDDPPAPGESLPDGDYTGTFRRFRLTIGNTFWDESMPHTAPTVRIVGDSGSEVFTVLTDTMPGHPDFHASLSDPAAGVEASWLAFDEVDGIDRGSLTGTYSVEANPTTPALGFGGVLLVTISMIAIARAFVARGAIRPADSS